MPQHWKKPCAYRGCAKIVEISVRFCEEHKKKNDLERTRLNRETNPIEQKFYNSIAWNRFSRSVREEEVFCQFCLSKGRKTFATQVDHIVPLRVSFDWRLSRDNVQSLCDRCHNVKRAAEGRYYMSLKDSVATKPVYLVIGPPGSGKTSFVRMNKKRDDLIIDLDLLYAAITGLREHDKPTSLLNVVLSIRNALIAKIISLPSQDRPAVWIVATAPRRDERKVYKEIFPGLKTIVMKSEKITCEKNILNRAKELFTKDLDVSNYYDKLKSVIEDWYDEYEPDLAEAKEEDSFSI